MTRELNMVTGYGYVSNNPFSTSRPCTHPRPEHRDPRLLHLLHHLPAARDCHRPESRTARLPLPHHSPLGLRHDRYGFRERLQGYVRAPCSPWCSRGWFLPQEVTLFYNDEISKGVYLVTVEGTENEIRRAEPILTRWGIQEWRVCNRADSETEC